MLASLPGLAFLMPSAITRNAVLIPAYRDTLTAMGIAQSDRTGRALMLASTASRRLMRRAPRKTASDADGDRTTVRASRCQGRCPL